tara:strand:- start:86 stop:205 length:120 start_codon:yes stop_codon:yes gene_type:complete
LVIPKNDTKNKSIKYYQAKAQFNIIFGVDECPLKYIMKK